MLVRLARIGRALATSAVQRTAIRSRSTRPPSLFLPTGDRTCTSAIRSFSSKKIIDIRRSEQKDVWEAYLVGSISADNLFAEIDLNKNGLISISEIYCWLESVERSGVKEEAWGLLQKLGDDHALDRKEFNMWLNMATELRNLNPMLEGILDGVKDDSSSSDSDSSDSDDDEQPRKMVDARRGLQKLVWDTYLDTGSHGSDLFKMIDLNRNGKLSVAEISYFIDSVDGKGVDIRDFARLKARGEDHELGEKEFLAWLTAATGVIHVGGEVGGGPVEDAGGEHASSDKA